MSLGNSKGWNKHQHRLSEIAQEMEKAATLVMLQPPAPARKPIAWIHAPSQPLMRSLLSQFQTPTAPRRVSRFFRVWVLSELLRFADHSAYFGLAKFYLSQPFQPSTCVKLNSCFSDVNGSFHDLFKYLWMQMWKTQTEFAGTKLNVIAGEIVS